jgi:inosine/xanthosine triphosphatase
MKVVVASKNPVKLNATRLGFEQMFPGEEVEIEGVSVPSGVSDQPMCNDEIYTGALNRAENASKEVEHADYWVGIEGGVEETEHGMGAFAWVVVKGKENLGRGKTGMFFLPKEVAKLVREGKELGEADDIVFKKSNSKQDNGAIGILTGDVLNRTSYYRDVIILALIPFKNRELY